MGNKDINPDRLLTTHQASSLLQVDPKSIINWVTSHRLVAFRTPGGHHRIRAADLVTFLHDNNMPVPQQLLPADKRRLLVVDDDPLILSGMKALLEPYANWIEWLMVDNGIEALVQVGAFLPHVILLDVIMPGLDGIEVCRRFADMDVTRNVRVVIVSAHLDDEVTRDALAAGAERTLRKPVTEQQVLEFLELGPDLVPMGARSAILQE